MARTPQIYVRSGAPDFGIANTIEDLGHRIAPRPQIYVRFETSVLGMGNTIGKAGRRVAQGAQIDAKITTFANFCRHGQHMGNLEAAIYRPWLHKIRKVVIIAMSFPKTIAPAPERQGAHTAGSEASGPGFTIKPPLSLTPRRPVRKAPDQDSAESSLLT